MRPQADRSPNPRPLPDTSVRPGSTRRRRTAATVLAGATIAFALFAERGAASDVIDSDELVRALSAPEPVMRTRSLGGSSRGIAGVREGGGEIGKEPPSASPRLAFSNILFAPGSARLESGSHPQLDELGLALRELEAIDPDAVFVIEGHTDAVGGSDANEALSVRRAEAVKSYLGERFAFPDELLLTVGHGERQPIASNDTEQGRRLNRRVVIARKP